MHSSRRRLLGATGLGGTALLAAAADQPEAAVQAVSKGPMLSGVDRKLEIVSLGDVEAEAHRTMSKAAWAFVANGSGDQWTLGENRRAFNDYPIATHRLRGVEGKLIGLGIRLLGHDLAYPIIVAPSGVHVFAHPKAEAATASGAERAGALYTASGASYLPLEQIAAATSGPKWFQAYLNADDGVTKEILLRAKNAGFTAIVLTADAIGPGLSDEFVRMGLPFPPGMTFGNNDPRFGGRGSFLAQKTAMTLDDIGTIRAITGLPVVVKGIMRPVDARDAVAAGAAAIQVSNHGGRQIDGVPASISVLSEVVDTVGGEIPVIFDGGIRRGIDVFRALALGATAVATARPVLYGAALGGASGVASVLEHLRDEFRATMLLAGTQTVADIKRDCLHTKAA
jgi:lactate oxidase